jgi:Lon protease-like protein
MFPLSTILFPHAQLPLHVFEPRYRELVSDCLAGDARFGTVLISRGSEVGGGDERMDIGTRAVIARTADLSDGRSLMMVEGETRIRVTRWLDDDPYPLALVEEWGPETEPDDGMLAHAVRCVRRARGLLSESGASAALSSDVRFDDDPDVASWQVCAAAPLNAMDAHRVLSAGGTVARLALLIELTEAISQDLVAMLASG